MSQTRKILYGAGAAWLLLTVAAFLVFGSAGRNEEFTPDEEFALNTWIDLPGTLDINKAVLYLVLSAVLTCISMVYIANRMQARPNRVQTAVETLFGLMRDNITRGNMDDRMAAKWFPFIGALFLFIWFNNLIGFIPLPTSAHKVDILGLEIPAFAIYAATANVSVPLALALVVFVSYTTEGIRAHGPLGYLKSLIPAGVHGFMAAFIFCLEVMSNLMRILSLSVRLFANMLAGHMIILFMSGGLAVILGLAGLGVALLPIGLVLYLFEVGLVATLQAFIFATLSAIYLGGAVAEHH
jgi:F-type H+-transporting ATPase subunit a